MTKQVVISNPPRKKQQLKNKEGEMRGKEGKEIKREDSQYAPPS
jgi:hypothetical protein